MLSKLLNMHIYIYIYISTWGSGGPVHCISDGKSQGSISVSSHWVEIFGHQNNKALLPLYVVASIVEFWVCLQVTLQQFAPRLLGLHQGEQAAPYHVG